MNHAKDYLIDFAQNKKQASWLKHLIYETILTNGKITSEKMDEIYSSLVENTSIVLPVLTNEVENVSGDVKFISLKHNSGVCALKENQIIKFCDNVTIMYGLNGSGKSSYFRILNEIIGGNQRKEILPNIYADHVSAVSVKFSYKIGSVEHCENWTNAQGPFAELKGSKVFDSSYLNTFLDSHEVDKTVIQPFGLHLFSYIIEKIDELKNKLQGNISLLNSQRPQIDTSHLLDKLKECFLYQKDVDEANEIVSRIVFSDEDAEKKNTLTKKISEIKSVNLDDRIRLLNGWKKEYQNLEKKITNVSQTLNNALSRAKEVLENRQKAIAIAELEKQKIALLKEIPGNDLPEWKQFITLGKTYSLKANVHEVCPYCRQVLRENAEKIILAYSDYLNDKSQKNLSDAENLFQTFKSGIDKLECSYDYTELFKDNLKESQLLDETISVFEKLGELKKNIMSFLVENNIDLLNDGVDTSAICDLLNKKLEDIDKNIEILTKTSEEKQRSIQEFNENLKELEERESIVIQKENIDKWFDVEKKVTELQTLYSSIKSNSISTLSGKAYNELVSDNLINNFNEMLSKLEGPSKLEVSLKPISISKGVAKTQLVLSNGSGVHKILSEGEQKAVGLALFLAEIKTQSNKNPIILDDPVNSLDHKIASNLAEEILALDNQVVIFSHNRLFVDAFECSKENHVCKTIDTDCNKNKGKHIRIYLVKSEGKCNKGVLLNYKGNCAKNHIESAKALLSRTPFLDVNGVALELRQSIECLVDEKILNNCIPTKLSNKNSRINWDDLKKVGVDESVVDEMNRMHSRLSGGNLHMGTEFSENPIEKEELDRIVHKLESML